MIKTQKEIEFINSCNCIVDYELLKKAMFWYCSKPLYSKRVIYIHSNYPAISIYDEKIHIHRLLMMYKLQSDIDTNYYVHHIDGNKLNADIDNLELIDSKKHQSYHNKEKKLTKEHRKKISEANRKRKGIKLKKRVDMPRLSEYIKQGLSINQIAQIYGCSWDTVRRRIYENKELLEEECQK
jgi:hypothetical protein